MLGRTPESKSSKDPKPDTGTVTRKQLQQQQQQKATMATGGKEDDKLTAIAMQKQLQDTRDEMRTLQAQQQKQNADLRQALQQQADAAQQQADAAQQQNATLQQQMATLLTAMQALQPPAPQGGGTAPQQGGGNAQPQGGNAPQQGGGNAPQQGGGNAPQHGGNGQQQGGAGGPPPPGGNPPPLGPGAPPAAPHAHAVHRSKRMDAPRLPGPDIATLADFRAWRDDFSGYVQVERLVQECSQAARQTIVKASLDGGWRQLLNAGTLEIAQTDDVDDVIGKVGDYLRRHRNPILDRMEFSRRNQRSSEQVDEYHAALRILDDNASHELEETCARCVQTREERMRDRLITGLRDPLIQAAVLERPFQALTLQETLQICRAKEASTSTQSTMQGGRASEVAIVDSERDGRNKSKSQYRLDKERENSPSRANAPPCGNCGRKAHKSKDDCPAKGKECRKCSKLGHFMSVCRSRQVIAVRCNRVEGDKATCRTDPIEVSVVDKKGGFRRKLKLQPDTGSGANLINLEVFQSLREDQAIGTSGEALTAANGWPIRTLGRIALRISCGGQTHKVHFIVTDEYEGALINRETCRLFKLIPENFPKPLNGCNAFPTPTLPVLAVKPDAKPEVRKPLNGRACAEIRADKGHSAKPIVTTPRSKPAKAGADRRYATRKAKDWHMVGVYRAHNRSGARTPRCQRMSSPRGGQASGSAFPLARSRSTLQTVAPCAKPMKRPTAQ